MKKWCKNIFTRISTVLLSCITQTFVVGLRGGWYSSSTLEMLGGLCRFSGASSSSVHLLFFSWSKRCLSISSHIRWKIFAHKWAKQSSNEGNSPVAYHTHTPMLHIASGQIYATLHRVLWWCVLNLTMTSSRDVPRYLILYKELELELVCQDSVDIRQNSLRAAMPGHIAESKREKNNQGSCRMLEEGKKPYAFLPLLLPLPAV